MGRPRSEFQLLLEVLLGSRNVYFQPPSDKTMQMKGYPAIVYERDDRTTQYADNVPYAIDTRYLVTVIDPDADSAISDKVAYLPMSSFNRSFTANDLNHFVYTIYY